MTIPNGLDSRLTAWLGDEAPARAPDGLLDEVARRAAHTRHRPGWATSERWIPLETRAQLGAIPRTAILLATLGLLLLMFAAIALGATGSPAPNLPPPFGLAGNGLIAYSVDGDIHVMDQHGEQRHQLTSSPDLDFPGVWSPDGTWLGYWSLTFSGDPTDTGAVNVAATGQNGSVKIIRADGTDQRTLASGLTWPSDCGTDLTWAPDSDQLAFAHQATVDGVIDSQVEVAQISGGAPRTLIRGGFTPSWSPDGQTIAFVADASPQVGTENAIFLIPAAGGEPTRLTQTTGSGCAFNEPQWSSDGSRLLFYDGSDGSHDIWVVIADGSEEKALTVGGPDEYWPRWSPDDTRIAFDRVVVPSANAPQFVLMDPDGGNQVMLDHAPAGPRYPTWSPDGTLLLGQTLTTDMQSTNGLVLVDVAEVEAPVTFETGRLWGDPAWQRVALPAE